MAIGSPQWVSVSPALGYPPPGVVDSGRLYSGGAASSASVPVGTIAQFRDVSAIGLGVGEFVYLPGNTGVLAGDIVTYNVANGSAGAGTVSRWAGTASTGQPLALATAALSATTLWGWYQIAGAGIANCTTAPSSGNNVYYGGIAASARGVTTAGAQMIGATFTNAGDGGTPVKAIVQLNRPHVQGQTS